MINDSTACDSLGYIDYSSVMGCTLNSGSTYTVSVGAAGSYALTFQAWIDFNNNGAFETSETVGGDSVAGAGLRHFNITIPAGCSGGTKRLRIEGEYNYHAFPNLNPCPDGTSAHSYYYGDVRDYAVTIDTAHFTASPASYTFPATTVGTTSAAGTVVLNAVYLSPASGNVTVSTSSSAFRVYDGSAWVSSYTISYTGAAISASSVQVDFSPTSSGLSTGNLTFSGGGVATLSVPLNGNGVSACSGTVTAGTASVTPTSGTSATTFTLSLTGYTASAGITFQWQARSPSGSGSWTSISGATSPTYSFSGMTVATDYACVVTCSYSGVSATTSYVTAASTGPTGSLTPSTLNFGTVTASTTSSPLTSIFNGTYLTPASGTLTVTAPANYQVCATSGGTYTSSYTLAYTSATVSAASIYAKFVAPATSGAYTGNICVTGGGLSSVCASAMATVGAAACSGTPSAGTISASAYTVCGSTPVTLSLSGYTTDLGITFQWMASSTGSGGWSNISGATNSSVTFTLSASMYYMCLVTCAYSGLSAYSSSVGITLSSTCPTLAAAPSSITFPATAAGASSAALNTVVAGTYLSPATGNITVTAPSNFKVNNGSAWVTSYTIAYTGGATSADTIPVQFNPPTFGSFSGNLTIAGGGAAVLNIPLNGTGIAVCSGMPTAGTASSSVTIASASTAITLTNSGSTVATGITLQWQDSTTGSSWNNISGATSAPWSFTGISVNTYYRCNVTCSSSGATASTAAILIIFGTSCSGTPTGGTAASTTYYCSACSATLSLTGCTVALGITYQWQKSPDGSTGWSNLSSAATSSTYTFTPNGDYYYRCAVKCSYSGLTGYSSSLRIVFPYLITAHSVTDSTSTVCNGPLFYVRVVGSSSLLRLKTWYGDGQTDSVAMFGSTSSTASTYHVYSHSGAYSVKQVVYFNNVPQDSIAFTHNYFYCRTLPIAFFVDVDGNGVYNYYPDRPNYRTATVRIDSNGTPVDTITATSGFYYPAAGPAGTVYAFRVLSPSSGVYYVSVPSSGVIYDTIVAAVNTYTRKYFGFACPTGAGYDLSERPVFGSGPHSAGGHIYIENNSCSAQSPIVTMSITPKFVFQSSYPSPYSVSGNVVTWHLGSMTATSGYSPYSINYRLNKPTGSADRHPGDTVHNKFIVIPDSGDIDTSNNHTDEIDTIRSSYDPNFIESVPSGHILAGTLLHYTAGFENDGNDTARNIYVLDTLSDYLDASTFKAIWGSHEMYTEIQHVSGMTIVKFDFPGINLLDSTHHDLCQGTFAYDVMVRPGVPDGTIIPARVGIYFEENEVVMTNEEHNIIGFPADVSVKEVNQPAAFSIYPNPATDVLNVSMDNAGEANLTITNSLGAAVMQQEIVASETKLDIKNLAPGIYFIKLSGAGNSLVKKFVKL